MSFVSLPKIVEYYEILNSRFALEHRYFLGLRQQNSRGNTNDTKPIVVNRTASLGLSILAELAAVFLAFPGGRCLQIMDESFFLQEDRTWCSSAKRENFNHFNFSWNNYIAQITRITHS